MKRIIRVFVIFLFLSAVGDNLTSAPFYPVRVTNIRFINGIGRGPTSSGTDNLPVYYRGYGLPGTLVEITADMNNGSWGAPMYGDVQFTVSYTDGANTGTFKVTMPSGSYTAVTTLPFDAGSGFNNGWITAGTTEAWTYSITAVTGDYAGALSSAVSGSINWDRNDPPYVPGTPAISVNQVVISATSVTLYWTPYSTVSTGVDQDFYEYLIYYREENTSSFKQWNSSHDSTLGGISNNPAATPTSDTTRHFDINGWKYTTIPNLKLFTGYEYYITAVDVFGNEISETDAGPAAGLRQIRTLPLQIEALITDGITTHTDFTDLTNPALRTLREANTRVDIYTVSSVTQPDECIIWFARTLAPAADTDNMVTPLSTINTAMGADLDSVAAVRIGPNIWSAYLPTIPSDGKNVIIENGNSVRFIVELKNRGISTFVDKDSGDDANNSEWTYAIGTPVKFKPWPVRILNNVITDKNPKAYPSYYLSEDAYVSIKIYDIKGRPLNVLLDKAFRRGGLNIKENGWVGNNKSGRKLGVGLYYVHIKAESASSGKTILDTFKKVVMSR